MKVVTSSDVLAFLTLIFLINMIGQIVMLLHVIKEGFAIPALKKNLRILSNSAIVFSIGINLF